MRNWAILCLGQCQKITHFLLVAMLTVFWQQMMVRLCDGLVRVSSTDWNRVTYRLVKRFVNKWIFSWEELSFNLHPYKITSPCRCYNMISHRPHFWVTTYMLRWDEKRMYGKQNQITFDWVSCTPFKQSKLSQTWRKENRKMTDSIIFAYFIFFLNWQHYFKKCT